MIELFKKTYQDGAEVYFNPKEKDELIEYIKSLEQDNERINNDATHLIELHKKTTEKNNKLNNIINEFDKWLENEIKFQKITDNDYFLRKAQRKLQELKGSDKE